MTGALVLAVALISTGSTTASTELPALLANRLEFERIGYHGAMYLNADHSYVIVQVAPGGSVQAFNGGWTANGATGFCMASADVAKARKCFGETPVQFDHTVGITSSLGEVYRVTLRAGR